MHVRCTLGTLEPLQGKRGGEVCMMICRTDIRPCNRPSSPSTRGNRPGIRPCTRPSSPVTIQGPGGTGKLLAHKRQGRKSGMQGGSKAFCCLYVFSASKGYWRSACAVPASVKSLLPPGHLDDRSKAWEVLTENVGNVPNSENQCIWTDAM